MSPKTVIGELYPCVMQDVINASTVDFEDAGVPAVILDELKSLWQKGLSNAIIARFPWDTPLPLIKDEPLDEQQWIDQNRGLWASLTAPTAPVTGFENGYLNSINVAAQYSTGLASLHPELRNPNHNFELAHSRAQQFYLAQQGYLSPSSLPQYLATGEPTQNHAGTFARTTMLHDNHYWLNQQHRSTNGSGGLDMGFGGPSSQSVEYNVYGTVESELSSKKNSSSSFEVKNSSLNKGPTIYDSTQPQNSDHVYIKTEEGEQVPSSFLEYPPRLPISSAPPQSEPPTSITQLDGGEDDASSSPRPIAEDEELNDGDDEIVDGVEGDDFEDVPELCVCLYDKVVRNRRKITHKWKCTLRDGVLITGGMEYPFSKGTAEFLW